MPSVVFNGFKEYINTNQIRLTYGVIHPYKLPCCALFDSNFVPDKDTMDCWNNIVASEISGTGYTTRGKFLTGRTVTHNDGTDKATFDADDLMWSAVTLVDVKWAVVYCYTEDGSRGNMFDGVDSKLICAYELPNAQNPIGIDFKIRWSPNGILVWDQTF